MIEHPEDRTIQHMRETVGWYANHPDDGVKAMAADVLILDALCRELYMAIKEPELVPSAQFKYGTLYDTFSV